MDPVAFKFLGAGLACIGMGLAAMGVGNIFGNFLSGALRNPSAADDHLNRRRPAPGTVEPADPRCDRPGFSRDKLPWLACLLPRRDNRVRRDDH